MPSAWGPVSLGLCFRGELVGLRGLGDHHESACEGLPWGAWSRVLRNWRRCFGGDAGELSIFAKMKGGVGFLGLGAWAVLSFGAVAGACRVDVPLEGSAGGTCGLAASFGVAAGWLSILAKMKGGVVLGAVGVWVVLSFGR